MPPRTNAHRPPAKSADRSGLFIPLFPKDLRRRIRIQALLSDTAMPDWMIEKLREVVEREERRRG